MTNKKKQQDKQSEIEIDDGIDLPEKEELEVMDFDFFDRSDNNQHCNENQSNIMSKQELWTRRVWGQSPTDEKQQDVYEVLVRFNRIIEDLNFLNDVGHICHTLGTNQNVRSRYKRFIEEYGDFTTLSESFSIMRNLLFSENMDWERLELMLKC